MKTRVITSLAMFFALLALAIAWTTPMPLEPCFQRAYVFVNKSGFIDKKTVRVCYAIPQGNQ